MLMASQEKANLARIRDNQRRSRARRKEYLQELEARLRQCELQGIEASSEIQIAARRVADENNKLRGLLAQHGVGDESVEAYLNSFPANETTLGQYGSSSAAVQLLEQLLQKRQIQCPGGSNPTQTLGPPSQDSSISSSTVQSSWDPMYSTSQNGGPRRSGTLQSTGTAASSTHLFMSPTASTASHTSRTSHASSVSMGCSSNRRIALRLGPVQPRNPSPIVNPSRNHQIFDFNILSNNTSQNQLQPINVSQRSSGYIPPASPLNNNNCNYAAEMITTMAGVDPDTVRSDLGCLPGMDCDVDNQLVFNVMDRYSEGEVGL